MAATVVGPLLRSPLHPVLSSQLMMLDYTGGRSGHSYSFPIGYFTWDDDEVLAFSSRSWPKALRTAEGIHLLIKGESHDATADVVSAHDDKTRLLAEFARRKGPRTAKRLMLGLSGDRQHQQSSWSQPRTRPESSASPSLTPPAVARRFPPLMRRVPHVELTDSRLAVP